MNWLSTWITRPVAVISWSVALLLGGAWAATQVPLEWVPQVELPVVRISAQWQGASPRQVERYVAAPIERSVQRVPGTESVESYSQEGRTTVTLHVSEDVDLGTYVAQVNDQLTLLREQLPDRVVPRLTKQVPEELRDEQGFMTLQLIGPMEPDELRALADERVAPPLASLSGVGSVEVQGGTERELLIRLDPDRLAAYQIPSSRAQQIVFEATEDAVYGRLRERGRQMLLMSPGEREVTRLQRLIIRPGEEGRSPVRLQDIATVERGPAPITSISRIDGQPVITLRLDRARGSHMLETARSVEERIEDIRLELPADTRILIADDRSEDVRAQIDDLVWRGGLGLVLVLFVLLFMLKSVRASAIVVFSVMVALAVALALMGPLGLTLNLLTLAGLVLVVGLLVDNAVVVVEQIILQRKRLRAHGRTGAALDVEATQEALRAVWLPLLGGTLSTMAVMLPLIYLSGDLRELFVPFGVLVALTLGVSLLTAALVVPVLARYLPDPGVWQPSWRGLRRWAAIPYRPAERFPKTTLAVLFLLLGVPLWLVPSTLSEPDDGWSVPGERLAGVYETVFDSDIVHDAREYLEPAFGGVIRPFFRNVDFGQRWSFEARPEVRVSLTFPPGNPIERTDSLIHIFERTALASESVYRTITNVSDRSASLRVQFREGTLETAEPYLLRERLIGRAAGQIAGIRVSIGGLLPQGYHSGIGGGISGMRVEALGPNYEDLEALTEHFADRLRRGSARVAQVNTNAGRWWSHEEREVLQFRWHADAAAHTGASASDLVGVLRPYFSRRVPLFERPVEDDPALGIRIVVDGADRIDVERLMEQPQVLTDTLRVQLSSVTDFSMVEVPAAIERENQQYKRYVAIDYRGPARMGREYVEDVLEGMPVPPGYRLEFGSLAFFTPEVQEAFTWVLLATLMLVFLVTAAIFESWRLPLVVMLSVPLAMVGVAAGFLWSDAAFAEGAFIGMVLLIGIAVNDSLLLTDRYRQLRALRPFTRHGVLARLAVRERLRPMWTTTLSTSVAMLPLIVFPEDSDFWLGLAVTVVGGLLAATLLAPLATVAMLSLRKNKKSKGQAS